MLDLCEMCCTDIIAHYNRRVTVIHSLIFPSVYGYNGMNLASRIRSSQRCIAKLLLRQNKPSLSIRGQNILTLKSELYKELTTLTTNRPKHLANIHVASEAAITAVLRTTIIQKIAPKH